MRISDWSSDVCSSDLGLHALPAQGGRHRGGCDLAGGRAFRPRLARAARRAARTGRRAQDAARRRAEARAGTLRQPARLESARQAPRSEEHTSEIQSLMRISYAVFCLKKNKLDGKRDDEYGTPIRNEHAKPYQK